MTTLAQLQGYLDEANASPTCPVCRNPSNHWKVETKPQGATLLTTEEHIVWQGDAVQIICMICGFIRAHHRHDIEFWKPRDAE